MSLRRKSNLFEIFLVLVWWAEVSTAQPAQGTMMEDGMMGGAWLMIACLLVGALFLVLLILGTLALLKYLRGK